MKQVELIIFDLDGTLVDSKDGIVRSVNLALEEVGAGAKDPQEIVSYIGTGVDDLIKKSLGERYQKLLAKTKGIFEDYRRNFPEDAGLFPGVKEILEYFRDKRKAIATNGKGEFAVATLKRLGILDYFQDVVSGDEVECLKPSTCPVDVALKMAGTPKEKGLIVGDMDVDILAGKKAGILTCAVTYGIGKREDILKAKPDFIIDNILELKNIIN